MASPLLSADTLARMRRLQESNLPHTCDLVAYVESRGAGAVTDRTAVVVDTVPCRVSAQGSSMGTAATQALPEAQYLLTFPIDTDLVAITRLVAHGENFGVAWALELEIVGPDDTRSYAASKQIRAKLATDAEPPAVDVGTITITAVP